MWLNRKREKEHHPPLNTTIPPTISAPIGPPISIPLDADFTSNGNPKKDHMKEEKFSKSGNGIRKRIMQLSARVQGHSFNESNVSQPNLTVKELSYLEETKHRLFSSSSTPLPHLKMSSHSFAMPASQFSPTMSSESAASTVAADFAFDMPKEFNVPGLSLPALAAVQLDVRELLLQRNLSGDFGFKIRRMPFPFGISNEQNEVCVFAEPIEMPDGPPRPSDLVNCLLPGDQLLEVNGRLVSEMSRDDLLQEIEQSGREILMRVRAMPELAEFCWKRELKSGDRNDALQLEGIADDSGVVEEIPDDERYWLIHSRGFTLCRLLERLPDGKLRIVVGVTETIVDSSDVDRANSITLNRVGDVALLKYLNETSVIHLLRQRYGANLLYTNGGMQNLIYISPSLANTEEIDCEENDFIHENEAINLLRLFRGCKRTQMPAHIYTMVQQIYRNLQVSNHHQSVIFTGVTGSRKSLQLELFLYYLCHTATSTRTKIVSYENLNCALGVFKAFGNCGTVRNSNATRYVQLLSLIFDTSTSLCAAKFQTFLMETSRLIPSAEKERTFHIFYYLWEGCDSTLRSNLKLDLIDEPFIYRHAKRLNINYELKWKRFINMLSQLKLKQSQIDGIVAIIAAIFHLSYANATQGPVSKSTFIRFENAEFAANLLGISLEKLSSVIFAKDISSSLSSPNPNFPSPGKIGINRFSMSNRVQTGQEALNSFIQTLYSELFSIVGVFVNKFLSQNEGGYYTQINILDIPGGCFSSTKNAIISTQSEKVNTLSDLVFNYVNERISELIYNVNFCDPVELYAHEQVQVVVEKPLATPSPLIRLLDKKQHLLNCVDVERRSSEVRGLFYILEEESMFPGATDDSFFERIFIHFEQNRLIRRHPRNRLQFMLGHCLNTSSTTYSVAGWLKQAHPFQQTLITLPQLLQNSTNTSITDLFTITGISHSTATAYKLRRSTQAVQVGDSGQVLGGFFSSISSQIDYFLNAITRQSSRLHFIHCLQPIMSLVDVTRMNNSSNSTNKMVIMQHNSHTPDVLDISYIRQQIRPIFFIDSVRANSRGYPERMSFRNFRRRFQCLIEIENQPQSANKTMLSLDETLDDRNFVQKILERMDIYEHRYRLGLSQILLRNDVLIELEDRRDLSLSGLVTELQYHCRKYLAKKWLARRRVQEVAIKCIQRNARLHLQLRDWPWWNLFTRISPLLSIVKSDSEQREWNERLTILKTVNAELKTAKLKLEGELAELEQHLKTECQTSQNLSLSLEQESQIRLRLEGEIRMLQQKLQQSQQQQTSLNESDKL